MQLGTHLVKEGDNEENVKDTARRTSNNGEMSAKRVVMDNGKSEILRVIDETSKTVYPFMLIS